jgi:hypothetical protein
LGFQYPARVTPFVEGRFVAGMAGATVLNTPVVSYMYVGGIDGGIELYVVDRFYLTAAIGWAHPVYSGVDLVALRAHPMLDPPRKDFATDSLTIKVGIGF